MANYLENKDICDVYTTACSDDETWKKDYHEYERLAENEIIDGLDESLPEVNDGSLSASLYKLPKRVISSDLKGRARPIDRDETWLAEIANMQWENVIVPNANSQAPFHRKWKDAVRKAGIYGGIPLISLLVSRGDYTGADFIVANPYDVHLEPGKVSDYDSDVIFWDIYLSERQLADLIDQAKEEQAEAKKSGEDGYNKWHIDTLEQIKAGKIKSARSTKDNYGSLEDKKVEKEGYHFFISFQRGVEAPFGMYFKSKEKQPVREWTNPDPTGDIPVHYLYCYQDFINPYGTGIVKLAGGTQNVLDYMRQADVLSTQLGLRPPISVGGDTSETDLDSIIYGQDQVWLIGNASVKREELNNNIYANLPSRISMYKTSLDQLIPTGDTSISASAGNPNYSKTPAGVKFQEANLSIDDEDFKDNVNITYEAVARSMINIHFANMQGKELMQLSEEEQQILAKSGVEFPVDENGKPTSQFELNWDVARASFDYEMDPDQDKAKDDEKRLEGLMKVAEFRASDPEFDAKLANSGMRINDGELYSEIIKITTDNDKIIEEISPEDEQGQEDQAMAANAQPPEDKTPTGSINYKDAPEDIKRQMEAAAGYQPSQELSPVQTDLEQKQQQLDQQHQQTQLEGEQAAIEQADAESLKTIMQAFEVDEETAMAMLEAEKQGFTPDQIEAALEQARQAGGGNDQ